MYGFKDHVLPSGRVVKLQGYEPDAVQQLLTAHPESDLDFDSIPSFPYTAPDGTHHVYHPALYLPGEGLIIEVKSEWTLARNYEVNRLKQQAVLAAGYRFQFWVKSKSSDPFRMTEDPLPNFQVL